MPEVVIRKRCLEWIEEAREGSERCLRYPMRYFSLYALLFSHKKVHVQPQEGAHTGKAMSGDLGKIDTGMHKHRGAKQIAESGFVHLFTGYWPRSDVRLRCRCPFLVTSISDSQLSSLLPSLFTT